MGSGRQYLSPSCVAYFIVSEIDLLASLFLAWLAGLTVKRTNEGSPPHLSEMDSGRLGLAVYRTEDYLYVGIVSFSTC